MSIAARDWRALSRLLDEALSLPSEARIGWVARLGAEHAAWKPILAELLTREDLTAPGGFLERLPRIPLPPD